MSALYKLAGLSKQAHLAFEQRRASELDAFLMLTPVIEEWRGRHKSMAIKKLYHLIQPGFIGREKFIEYCVQYGYAAVRYARAPRTSVPIHGFQYYPNLLQDIKLCDVNQAWVADITYLPIGDKFLYIALIMDLYSRLIVGFDASDRLLTHMNLRALQMALDKRRIKDFQNQLVHHSDRGAQYASNLYTQKLLDHNIQISMSRCVYENIHIERAHQIIKGEYLFHLKINNLDDLMAHLPTVVTLYNEQRPHGALNYMNPIEFERYICNIPLCQRTNLPIYSIPKKQLKTSSKNYDPAQLRMPF